MGEVQWIWKRAPLYIGSVAILKVERFPLDGANHTSHFVFVILCL